MLDDLSLQVQSIYDQHSKKSSETEHEHCPCPNPTPLVSLLEMLPVALEMCTGQDLKGIMQTLARGPERCIFCSGGKCTEPFTRPSPCLLPQLEDNKELEQLRAKLASLSPLWTEKKYPINQALSLALEKMFAMGLQNGRSPDVS